MRAPVRQMDVREEGEGTFGDQPELARYDAACNL